MDLAKYRTIFLEESTEHFAEISTALLELEKDPTSHEAIDVVFRMAHSIKGMAASLGYDSIASMAHTLEDRMQAIRDSGRVAPGPELSLLFRGLSGLEAMVESVREDEDPRPPDPELLAELSAPREEGRASPETESVPAKKKTEPPTDVTPAHAAALVAPRPPPTVRVNTNVLDRFLSTVGEVILNTSQVRTASSPSESVQSTGLSEGLDRMDRVVGELQRRALALRTTQLQRILEPLPRAARDVAEVAGVKVEVEIRGAELELDRSILDRLSDPLVHLLRNAVDHGIESPSERLAAGKHETGKIVIQAHREKDSIHISISDDGAGIDLPALRQRAVEAGALHRDLADDLEDAQIAMLVFEPGLSTASEVSQISGRGVGMDAVRATLESLGGSVEVATQCGVGTTTSLQVPITAAVQRVLLLGVGLETVALPISRVERIEELPQSGIERVGEEAFALLGEELIPVFDLDSCIAQQGDRSRPNVNLVLTEMRGERVGLTVERVSGQQQIYVKPVPDLLESARALTGLTILGDGRPMFLIDPNQIA